MIRVLRRVAYGRAGGRLALLALVAGSVAVAPAGVAAQSVAALVSGAHPAEVAPGAVSAGIVPVTPERGATAATAVGPRGAEPRPEPAPTAARDLPRGTTLTEADIVRPDDHALAAAEGGEVGEGWVTRRLIAMGEPLRRPAVAPPVWVTSGEPVQLLFRVGSVEARLRGTALGSAAKDERVLVRIDTRRRVEGVVVAPGLVNFQGEFR